MTEPSIAVNVVDFYTYSNDIGIKILLEPIVSETGPLIECESGRFDSIAIRLHCEEKRALAIIELIRKKYKKHQFRFYRSPTGNGGWKRI